MSNAKFVIEVILAFALLLTLSHFLLGQQYNFQEQIQIISLLALLLSGFLYLAVRIRQHKRHKR